MSCENLAGHNARLYMIDESQYGKTPAAGAWDWMGVVKDLSPTFNPNVTKLTGISSRRYLERLDGDHQVNLKAQLAPKGPKNILDWFKLALGSSMGVTDDCLPSKSLEAILAKDGFYMANLYNGVKLKSLGLSWTYGQPLSLDLDMVAQAVQISKVSSGAPDWLTSYVGFQGSSGTPLTIGSRVAQPTVPAYNFTDIPRPQIDWGAGLVSLPPIDGLTLTAVNNLVLIPGSVEGDDGELYPFPEEWSEEGQEMTVGLTINPKHLDIYERLVNRLDLIDELKLILMHPTGSGLSETIFSLTGGGIDTGDMSIKELVLMKQPVNLSFNSLTTTST